MDQRRRGRNTTALWGSVLLAIAYVSLLYYVGPLTGINMLDSIIGVTLGLYICSHPAAHAVDLLFVDRGVLPPVSSAWSGLGWLALNMLVMLVGWLVVFIAITRFVGRVT